MQLFSWQGLLALILGGFYGALFGAIPGLTATLAVALFIPVAFFLDPMVALPAIIAISSVAIYAGDVGSTVAKIPGTPASAAYLEELYRIGRKRGPYYGLGISALGSSVGGILGTILLIVSAGSIASFTTNFSSFEYFWIAVLGLTAGVFAAGGSPVKGLVSLLLGLLLATVGMNQGLSNHPRFYFDIPDLLGGVNYIVAMIGLFGFSEVLDQLYQQQKAIPDAEIEAKHTGREFFLEPARLIIREKWLVIRSSLIGVFVGFLPGAGADIGAWVSSSFQKIRSNNDEAHDDQVVLAGTSSNNAAVASAWIPALSLGLPGDTVTAIVLGVFLMKGITPGPLLFEQQPGLIASLYLTFLISNVVLLPFYGYLTARLASFLINLPVQVLMSVIAGICVVGAYAINNSVFDVWVMLAMGLLAFGLKRGKFPLAQVVLGMVLGPIMEKNFMISAIKSKWDFMSFFERPIALVLMVLTIVLIGVALWIKRKYREPDSV